MKVELTKNISWNQLVTYNSMFDNIFLDSENFYILFIR